VLEEAVGNDRELRRPRSLLGGAFDGRRNRRQFLARVHGEGYPVVARVIDGLDQLQVQQRSARRGLLGIAAFALHNP